MRFELSNSPPPHQNRRFQLRMLGFVSMIAVIMFFMSTLQPKPEPRNAKPLQELPGSPDAPMFQVKEDIRPTLKDDEFVSPPPLDDEFVRPPPLDDESWHEPPPLDRKPGVGDPVRKIARLDTQFDTRILRRVKDNTLGIRHDESDAYYKLLEHTRRVAASDLEQAGATDVLYINLMTQPDRFRGQPVTIHGDLWRLYEFQAGPNPYGFETLYEAWIFTADSGRNPYRVVLTSLPRDLEPGENIRKPVQVTGYFFKREGYASSGGMHVAPTLLAQRVVPFRRTDAAPSTDAIVPYMIGLISAIGLSFLVTLASFAISDRRASKAALLREANAPTPSFDGIVAGPMLTVEESLRRMEAQEWQAEADATDEDYDVVSASLRSRDRTSATGKNQTVSDATEAELAERRRDAGRAVQAWTAQRAGKSESPPPRPSAPIYPEFHDHRDAGRQMSIDDDRQPPVSGNGLAKLQAWEHEIQQLAAQSRKGPLTEQQRAAQADLDRDEAAREQEFDDRLRQQRAELEQQQQRDARQASQEELSDREALDQREDREQAQTLQERLTIDRADRRQIDQAKDADSESNDDNETKSSFWPFGRRRRRRDGR
jgi:hypothetical protein